MPVSVDDGITICDVCLYEKSQYKLMMMTKRHETEVRKYFNSFDFGDLDIEVDPRFGHNKPLGDEVEG